MKNLILTTICFLLSITLTAQNYGFEQGTIITSKNDTINCYVEMAVTYGNEIGYKNGEGGTINHFKIEDIKSISTPFNYFERISIENKDRIMALSVDGKAKLYTQVIVNQGETQATSYGTYQYSGPPSIIYVLLKDSNYIEMNKKKLKELDTILSDCTTLSEKISSKRVKFKNLEDIIREYNSCK